MMSNQEHGVSALLWAQAKPRAYQSLYHPFVTSLASGTLCQDRFQAFLLQDAYYLQAFIKAFGFAMTKTTDPTVLRTLVKLIQGIEKELATHHSFLSSFGIDTFTIEKASAASSTLYYTSFLLETAQDSATVAPILAAMAPCVKLYSFLGSSIAALVDKAYHPYTKWIDTYASPGASSDADLMENLLDQVCRQEDVGMEELTMLYNTGMQLELEFFESFYPCQEAYNEGLWTHFSRQLPLTVAIEAKDDHVTDSTSDKPGVYALTPGSSGVSLSPLQVEKYVTYSTPLYSLIVHPQSSTNVFASSTEANTFIRWMNCHGSFDTYKENVSDLTSKLRKAASTLPRVLIIAGSDSGGGAGVQADLKTCTSRRVYASSVLTAITVQNTHGVHGVSPVDLDVVRDQLKCVLSDIGTDVIKTGALINRDMIRMIAHELKDVDIPLVIDPVMVSASGSRLLDDNAQETLEKELLPLATVLTPNIPEAESLLRQSISQVSEMQKAAKTLADKGPRFVLLKGGHLVSKDSQVVDVLFDKEKDEFFEFKHSRIDTRNSHGTGCTLASAMAAEIAKGNTIPAAAKKAIAYVQSLLDKSKAMQLGSGSVGPMIHFT